ncbi:hypothetical protein [Streptomyces ambofaciens]
MTEVPEQLVDVAGKVLLVVPALRLVRLPRAAQVDGDDVKCSATAGMTLWNWYQVRGQPGSSTKGSPLPPDT